MVDEFVAGRGARLWSCAMGQGSPVVLVNGGPGCADYLAPVAELIDHRVQAIRYEPSGCGRSDANPPYDIDNMIADLEAVRVHYGVDQWTVIGHSFGADLALIYAMRYPHRVRAVICLSGGRFHNDREWHRVYDERRQEEVHPEFASPPNMEVCRQGNRSFREYLQRPMLWKELTLLDVPVLFVYGSHDIRPPWCVQQVANVLPNARFVMLDGCDHYLWRQDPERLANEMNTFLDQSQ